MSAFKGIAEKLLKKNRPNGKVVVGIDDLVGMRKYIKYFRSSKSKTSASLLSGDVKSVFKGRGIEFEEVRQYAIGDDVRDMDWRVTARKSEPYIKVFLEERDREIYVLIDMSATMVFGTKNEFKSVFAAKTAAMLGWIALENKDRFGCIIYDGTQSFVFKAKSGIKNLLAIFKKISSVSENVLKNSAIGNLSKPLKLLENTLKTRGDVFVLSDFFNFDSAVRNAMFAVGKKSKSHILDISDVLEQNAPKAGEYLAQYENNKLTFNTYNQAFRDEYAAYFAEKKKKIKDFASSSGSFYAALNNSSEIYRQLKLI